MSILWKSASYWFAGNIFKFWHPVWPHSSWLYEYYKISMFGTLGLGFCIRIKILCLQERFNYVFCCAHKEIMFSLGIGNDSNEITNECVRYITQVCLTKQNVSRIIFMPISYHMYNNSQFFFFMKMLNWRFSLCDLLALVRSKDSLHLHFHQSFLSVYVGLKHKMHK